MLNEFPAKVSAAPLCVGVDLMCKTWVQQQHLKRLQGQRDFHKGTEKFGVESSSPSVTGALLGLSSGLD